MFKLTVIGWRGCRFYEKAQTVARAAQYLNPGKYTAEIRECENRENFQAVWGSIKGTLGSRASQHASSPAVVLNENDFIGGCDDLLAFIKSNPSEVAPLNQDVLDTTPHNYDYDLIVIGGGSGGLAASKAAASLGAKVMVCDFVRPSPQGTTWGLGGTCVNVGCIPKKLMHQAGLLRDYSQDGEHFGWPEPNKEPVNWETLVNNVQMYIKSLNWGYRTDLRSKQVDYENRYARFVDAHTVELTDKKGDVIKKTARRFLIAVGGRPTFAGIPGAEECCISSDDLFSMRRTPGKTLCVGASYVSLECAGFLTTCGFDTTVMVRSILLRGFDQDMAERIGNYMSNHGTKLIRGAVPTKFEKTADGKVKVFYHKDEDNSDAEEIYDTVLMAIGRRAETDKLNLEAVGVKTEKDGKIDAPFEQTNIPHIYAIGDVLKGRQELTPVAIQAGTLLAQRLYANSRTPMDYDNVPTTVFTPLEYGSIGLSEEQAIEKYGADNIEIYHSGFKPLEWALNHERPDDACYCKLIVNKNDNERVIGFHYLGPNAGEVTQGYGIAFKTGASKADFDRLVGIHPTVAEEFTTLSITKSSGQDATKTGC